MGENDRCRADIATELQDLFSFYGADARLKQVTDVGHLMFHISGCELVAFGMLRANGLLKLVVRFCVADDRKSSHVDP
jgi:hypothetical protein